MPGRWSRAVPVGVHVRYSSEVSKTPSVVAGAARRAVAPTTLVLLIAALLTPPASIVVGWALVEASIIATPETDGGVLVNSTLIGIALGMALTVAAFLLQVASTPADI